MYANQLTLGAVAQQPLCSSASSAHASNSKEYPFRYLAQLRAPGVGGASGLAQCQNLRNQHLNLLKRSEPYAYRNARVQPVNYNRVIGQ